MPNRRRSVVDSNVLIVANGKGEQANDACIDKCIEALQRIVETESLGLDGGGEIMDEYSRYCDHSGRPGPGDWFFVWARDNQWSENFQRIPITPHQVRGFEEFPDTPELANFDPSDRKFVATALGCTPPATIHNAVDSDWSHHAQPLAAAGVQVKELCPDCLKPGHQVSF
jgi:hypothetical protein